MTEFEAATLAYQAATVTYQYAGLWVSGGVGAAQCVLIGFGIWFMRQSAYQRDRQHGEAMAADAKRHEEFMAKHEETMAAISKRHDEVMAALSQRR